MGTTLELVRELPDSQVVEVAKELFRRVYVEIPYDEVSRNFGAVMAVEPLVPLDEATLRRDLSAEDSARLGRLLLEQYAGDPALEPLVQQAVDKVQGSDNMVVDVILAVGLVVNLTLLIATTKVKVEKGPDGELKWQVTKGEASPELVKAVVEPVIDVAKAGG